MKFIPPFLLLPFLFTLSLWSASPVPYSGKIDIRGVNYFGEAQFAFSLHDGNGTTHWRNGNQPKETIKVTIRNGRYSVLLGGQGMNSLAPELFLNHDKLYLKVEVDMGDGEGLRHLAPDQLITATPRALVADIAKVAEKVSNGVITRDMLSQEVLSQLDANATASPSAPITITRDMLPQDVRDDLNKTITITRNMLPADVLSDLNRTISKSMLGSDVLADLNKSSTTASPITLSMLAPEVTAKLDSNASGSTTINNPPAVGSLIALPYGQNAPAGYMLYQRGTPKTLVWEEKAAFSQSRAFLGAMLQFSPDGKIFALGGHESPSTSYNLVESYDPLSNTWTTKQPLTEVTFGQASTYYENKIYVLGGYNLSKVEVYDPQSNQWSVETPLPVETRYGSAVSMGSKIYFGGGRQSNTILNTFYSYSSSGNWIQKANMNLPRAGHRSLAYKNRIWIIGGGSINDILNSVEIYNPDTNSWTNGPSLVTSRSGFSCWIWDNKIFVAGGFNENGIIQSIEYFDSEKGYWQNYDTLPTPNKYSSATSLNDKIYIFGGVTETDSTGTNTYSNKLYAADLNASVDGVYDLYRKDGNASAGTPLVQAEVADGSVTASKMAAGSVSKSALDATILKYLKPEITTQPQAQTVYADTNASFYVAAEGKYLTYQWKKDDSKLTGETNATLTITDANATQDDGNYSVVVSNDFGSVESNEVLLDVNTSLLDGLVGWWKFDETNGTIAYDSSGNGNDGNLTNGPTWTSGKIGGALSFDGVDDRVKIPHTILDQKLAFTVSLWFNMKMGSDSSYHAFITAANSSNANAFTFEKRPDHNMMIRDMGEDSISAAKTSDFWTSTWRHVTLAKSSLGIVFYLSGEELYSKNYSTATTSVDANGLWIGPDQDSVGGGWQSGQSVKGELDDYRIYDRALSAAEVQALYNLGE
ncbi:hypothetical protein N8X69_02625 [Opitutales bacterium]|nr:hypothetical protein [Opitutales bacterium]